MTETASGAGATLSTDDQLAITDLLARYCHASDERDVEALRAMLTYDHVGDLGPAGVHTGRDEVLAISSAILSGVEVTQHQVTTSVFTAYGGDALAKTNFTARHIHHGAQFTVGGVYYDHMVRSDATWLIAARRIAVTWTEGDPAILGLSLP